MLNTQSLLNTYVKHSDRALSSNKVLFGLIALTLLIALSSYIPNFPLSYSIVGLTTIPAFVSLWAFYGIVLHFSIRYQQIHK